MSKIQLKTLTPVHVGSGVTLQYNTDFVTVNAGEVNLLRIIDDRKILDLVGAERLNDWLLSIEKKENTKDFVKRYAPAAKVADYSKRRLLCYAGEIKEHDTLKECIHSGLGKAYIPGSSIKGAVRSALVASLADKLTNTEMKIRTGRTDFNGIMKLNATKVEKELFGESVNEDLFRFLQIGDVCFENDVEIATRMVNINIREKRDFWDTSKPQLVEAIDQDEYSDFQMKVLSDSYTFAQSNSSDKFNLRKMPEEMKNLQQLFSTINAHTLKLLEEELALWTEYIENDSVAEYTEKINHLIETAKACREGVSCVLRIGHGSGWRFITGAWTEKLANFESEIMPASRPNNQRYEGYVFPKSRRLDEDGKIFGFVKLTIKD